MSQTPPKAPSSEAIEILREGQTPPPALARLNAVFDDARVAGLSVAVAVHARDDETRRQLAKRRHDLKAALRTFNFTVQALDNGYRFDDDKAAAKIEAIRKALVLLERESSLTYDLLCAE